MKNLTSTRLIASAPAMLVSDLAEAVAYYREALGFTGQTFGDPPHFAMVDRDGLRVMLKQADDPAHVVPNWKLSKGLWNIYFWVDNVDALYMELQDSGAIIDYELCDQPYGCREFGVRDPDGHDIGFGQIIER